MTNLKVTLLDLPEHNDKVIIMRRNTDPFIVAMSDYHDTTRTVYNGRAIHLLDDECKWLEEEVLDSYFNIPFESTIIVLKENIPLLDSVNRGGK